jgi:hypothetical protein
MQNRFLLSVAVGSKDGLRRNSGVEVFVKKVLRFAAGR